MCDSPPRVKDVKDLKASGTGHERSEVDEKELERLAMEALLQEAKRAKTRAEQVGAMGWQKCELPRTNKRFLGNVVMGAMASNKKQRLEPQDTSPKQNHRKHRREIVAPERKKSSKKSSKKSDRKRK